MPTRWELIRDMIGLVDCYAAMEAKMLLKLYDADPMVPLFVLSEKTSELIFSFQERLFVRREEILADEELVWKVMEQYIPRVLVARLGRESIMKTFGSKELEPYRDAIVTKKLASMAYYRFCLDWETYLAAVESAFSRSLNSIFAE